MIMIWYLNMFDNEKYNLGAHTLQSLHFKTVLPGTAHLIMTNEISNLVYSYRFTHIVNIYRILMRRWIEDNE